MPRVMFGGCWEYGKAPRVGGVWWGGGTAGDKVSKGPRVRCVSAVWNKVNKDKKSNRVGG